MAVDSGKFYVCSKTDEVFELVYCEDGEYMVDCADEQYIPVVKNKYNDDAYNECGKPTRFFTSVNEEGEEA